MGSLDDVGLSDLLHRCVDAIAAALATQADWGLAGTRAGQHSSDLAADAAAVGVLDEAGVGVLSEESGVRRGDAAMLVVVDPLDGSTNASRGVPWYAASLCALDAAGPRAALVADLVHGTRFEAVRGGGAWRVGPGGAREPLTPSGATRLDESLVGLSGFPPGPLGWRQYRALGAAALDLCAVASGTLDGYVDCSADAHGVWDYLGALLICQEAGAVVVDAAGRDLVTTEPDERRTPVAGATPELAEELAARRRAFLT